MYITEQPISVGEFLGQTPDKANGACASFVGVVRNQNEGKAVKKIYYECYAAMANKEIERILEEAKQVHGVSQVSVRHRVGWLNVGEAAVAIWVSSAHREEAFLACKMVIDEVKARAPIWKQEMYVDGTRDWVFCAHAKEVAK